MDDKKPSDENKAGAPLKKDKDGKPLPKEYGGVKGPEPTRYGDWTNGGRTTDF